MQKVLSAYSVLYALVAYSCGKAMTHSRYQGVTQKRMIPFFVWFLSGFLHVREGSSFLTPSPLTCSFETQIYIY